MESNHTFADLSIGATFDWINDQAPGRNSYFERCVKCGPRSYQAIRTDVPAGPRMRVGSTRARVFHVSVPTGGFDAQI